MLLSHAGLNRPEASELLALIRQHIHHAPYSTEDIVLQLSSRLLGESSPTHASSKLLTAEIKLELIAWLQELLTADPVLVSSPDHAQGDLTQDKMENFSEVDQSMESVDVSEHELANKAVHTV